MSNEIHFPNGFGINDIVSWGNTGMVVLDRSSNTVIKTPHDATKQAFIDVERRIYERLSEGGTHEGLLVYHGSYDSGIRLEYASNGSIPSFVNNIPSYNRFGSYIWRLPKVCVRTMTLLLGKYIVDLEGLKLRWIQQVATALAYLHSKNILHGDLTSNNIFLDEGCNAKLGDFGGSSMDGSPFLVGVTASHRYPGSLLSVQGDMFALGSTLYEIMTGKPPYEDLSEDVITARYLQRQFPETESLGRVGEVVLKCWGDHYGSVDTATADLQAIKR